MVMAVQVAANLGGTGESKTVTVCFSSEVERSAAEKKANCLRFAVGKGRGMREK
jgi:hypothetical protein